MGQDFPFLPSLARIISGLGVIKVRHISYKFSFYTICITVQRKWYVLNIPLTLLPSNLVACYADAKLKRMHSLKCITKTSMDANYTIQIMIHQNYHCKKTIDALTSVHASGKSVPWKCQQLPCSLIDGYYWNCTLNTWIVSAEPAWFIDLYRMLGKTSGTSTCRLAQVSR